MVLGAVEVNLAPEAEGEEAPLRLYLRGFLRADDAHLFALRVRRLAGVPRKNGLFIVRQLPMNPDEDLSLKVGTFDFCRKKNDF